MNWRRDRVWATGIGIEKSKNLFEIALNITKRQKSRTILLIFLIHGHSFLMLCAFFFSFFICVFISSFWSLFIVTYRKRPIVWKNHRCQLIKKYCEISPKKRNRDRKWEFEWVKRKEHEKVVQFTSLLTEYTGSFPLTAFFFLMIVCLLSSAVVRIS